MKLKEGFITHTVMGSQMMVAAGPAVKEFHGMVRSNESAALIIDCLKKDTTKEAIIAALLEKYEVEQETAERDVERILEKLDSIGALE